MLILTPHVDCHFNQVCNFLELCETAVAGSPANRGMMEADLTGGSAYKPDADRKLPSLCLSAYFSH